MERGIRPEYRFPTYECGVESPSNADQSRAAGTGEQSIRTYAMQHGLREHTLVTAAFRFRKSARITASMPEQFCLPGTVPASRMSAAA